MGRGLLLAAHGSGAGKTTITLGLLRALKNRGLEITPAKSGPDYIDRAFHEAACASPSINLDAYAMGAARLSQLTQAQEFLLVEGAMGLFDGAPPSGKGSGADLAKTLGLPVILIIDASHQAQSIAALVAGFVQHDPDTNIVGLILNKVGSSRHERILRLALSTCEVPILGAIPRNTDLTIPSRHLGLVQAEELEQRESLISTAAELVEQYLDIDQLLLSAASLSKAASAARKFPPLAQRIAIASDVAFRFTYPHILQDWRDQGAELSFFSPLANEAQIDCDAVFLPGGYPELYAGQLAAADQFKSGVANAPKVYGECGGYMVMGKHLIDKKGNAHEMLGLLNLVTSFEEPKLHLGYRHLTAQTDMLPDAIGHEFHFASTIKASGAPLFSAKDAENNDLGQLGLINGTHFGSFAHIIDMAP